MGTVLVESSSYDNVVCPNPGEPVRAGSGIGTPITIPGLDGNGNITYTGLVSLARVQHLGGISKTLAVTVSGNDVTVQLGTDGSGNVTSTAQAVVNQILATPAALALLNASYGGTGLGLPSVISWVSLGLGPVGSIRPPLQALVNRIKWVRDKFYNFINGLLSAKSIVVDNVGDATTFPGEHITLKSTGFVSSNVGTGASDGNPPGTTALRNELRPLNISKAWGLVETNGASGITVRDSCSSTSAVISGTAIRVNMATPMSSVYYAPQVTLHFVSNPDPTLIGKLNAKPQIIDASSFYIIIYNSTNGSIIDVTSTAVIVSYEVSGRQT